MTLEIANVTKDRPDLYPLLDKAYHDIYVPAFPDDDERDSLEKIKDIIEGRLPKVGIAVNLLGENLDDPDPAKRVIKGIGIAYYYEPQNVGLLAYNAIAPEHRERGLGKILVQSRIQSLKKLAKKAGKELGGVFIEVNDPKKVSPETDSMDPAKRVKIFQEWGAVPVPIDYVQPPVALEGCYCESLMLMNYPLDGKYAGKKEVEGFLRGIFREFRSDRKPDQDYFFKKMKKELDGVQIGPHAENNDPGYTKGAPDFKFLP